MAKTMRNVVITCIMLIAIAAVACALVLNGGLSNMNIPGIGNPFAGAQTTAANVLIDTSGIKDRIEAELYSRVDEVSAQTGIPAETLEAGIADLAIQDWKAIEKPAAATAAGNFSVNAGGTQIDVTTYADPSFVTVNAYGQEVTLTVPESARQYADYLPLLQYGL